MSYHNDDEDEADKDTGMLLNLSQKSSIFVADQTPTPTRLIKNCEEVGLFEDLRNVNPFDETFRRACEQNVKHGNNGQHFQIDEDSLHTPQVFPQFDAAVEGGIIAAEDLTKQTLNTPVVLDVSTVEHILDVPQAPANRPKSAEPSLTKYRAIAEKSAATIQTTGISFSPSTVQFIQPQIIAVTFPSTTVNPNSTITNTPTITKTLTKSKPYLLPKLSTTNTTATKDSLTTTTPSGTTSSTQSSTHYPEPSSASMTPTSQLPIKERLKAILNQSSKTRPAEWSEKTCTKHFNSKSSSKSFNHKSSKDDTMERRRAASTRYRHKIRNEHKDLKKRNIELQLENDKLKQRIKELETEVSKLQSTALQPILAPSSSTALGVPAQIQIPASTIHLVMSIPKLVVPCSSNDLTTQTILKNPNSYRIDKN